MQRKVQNINLRNKMPEEKQKIEDKKEEVKEKKIVETPKEIVNEKDKDVEKKSEPRSEIKEEIKQTEKTEKETEKKDEPSKEKTEEKSEDKKEPEKKPVQTKPKVKKTKAVVNSFNLPISTKHSIAVCKFIKGKKIENAMNDLEKVISKKLPVKMKGEIPHRKGMMSGRYPKKAAQHFIKLLKSLSGNVNVNELESPMITEAVANIGSRPYGRFGRVRRKRTHIKIITKEKVNKEAKK